MDSNPRILITENEKCVKNLYFFPVRSLSRIQDKLYIRIQNLSSWRSDAHFLCFEKCKAFYTRNKRSSFVWYYRLDTQFVKSVI